MASLSTYPLLFNLITRLNLSPRSIYSCKGPGPLQFSGSLWGLNSAQTGRTHVTIVCIYVQRWQGRAVNKACCKFGIWCMPCMRGCALVDITASTGRCFSLFASSVGTSGKESWLQAEPLVKMLPMSWCAEGSTAPRL